MFGVCGCGAWGGGGGGGIVSYTASLLVAVKTLLKLSFEKGG